jgi:hypothetical protein
MNEASETGSSGSSYISHGSYQYIIDIPDPPTEWSPDVPRPGILLSRKNQESFFPSFSNYTDTDSTVDTIQREDILDTASKPIQANYYEWWNNPEKQLLLPGGVFQNQCFFHAAHLHHPKAYGVNTPPDYGYVSRGHSFIVIS